MKDSQMESTVKKIAATDSSSSRGLLDAAKLAALAISALAVFGTLTGTYYQVGQLRGFNLPQSHFPVQLDATPRLIHQALVSISGNYLIKIVDHWGVILLAVLGAIIVWVVISALAFKKASTGPGNVRLEAVKKWAERPLVMGGISGAVIGATVYLVPRGLVSLLAIALLAPVSGYYAGIKDAETYLAKWEPCAGPHRLDEGIGCSTIEYLRELPDGSKRIEKILGDIVVGNDNWLGIVTDTEVVVAPARFERLVASRIRVAVNRPASSASGAKLAMP
jgi:hypothetical protein